MAVDELGVQFAVLRECTLIARKWRKFYDHRIAAYGLTAARAGVLYWLSETPNGLKQVELAAIAGIEGPTLVRLLHALEGLGLVERSACDDDSRAKMLNLTAAGLEMVEIIRTQNEVLSKEALISLSERNATAALRNLTAVRIAINATADTPTSRKDPTYERTE